MTATSRTCHYEILGVDMKADVDEIRKSYKRAALVWHPDKNMHQVDVATDKFRLISEAYQVLSDAKERAWYDTHRESILRGGDGTAGDDSSSYYVPDLWKFFSNPKSKEAFYEQFTSAFEEIVQAEHADLDRQDAGAASYASFPEFGTEHTPFEDVKRFYEFWEYFNSKMTFSWKDKYDVRETENRFQRRHVEKINEQERSAHRKEYSNLVRSLALYCLKRDERYMRGQREQEAKLQEKRDKQLAWERDRKEAKQRQKDEVARMRREEALAREAEEGAAREGGGEGEGEGEEEEEEVVVRSVWNCGVCSKEFKSEKQLDNHEGSKKHKDAVKAFLKKNGGVMPAKQPQQPPPKVEEEESEESEEEEELAREMEQVQIEDEEEDGTEEEEDGSGSGDDDEEEEEEDGSSGAAAADHAPSSNKKKIGKAKLKRLLKQKKLDQANSAKQKQTNAAKQQAFTCGMCFQEFPSNSKLFQHIKDLDHAMPLPDSGSSKSSKRR